MFPSRKFCSFFYTIFISNAAPIIFFCSIFFCFLCWPEKLENQLWFSCFFTCSFFCCFRIPFFCCTASDSFVCFCCVVLFYFAPSICRPLFSPIFYITTLFIISFAKHSHTRTLTSPSYSHSRLVCFSPHSRNVSRGVGENWGVSTVYTEHIIYS